MEIKLTAEGAVPGNTFVRQFQRHFDPKDWIRAQVTVNEEVFKMGVMGGPGKLMSKLTALRSPSEIVVELPEDIETTTDGVTGNIEIFKRALEAAIATSQV